MDRTIAFWTIQFTVFTPNEIRFKDYSFWFQRSSKSISSQKITFSLTKSSNSHITLNIHLALFEHLADTIGLKITCSLLTKFQANLDKIYLDDSLARAAIKMIAEASQKISAR